MWECRRPCKSKGSGKQICYIHSYRNKQAAIPCSAGAISQFCCSRSSACCNGQEQCNALRLHFMPLQCIKTKKHVFLRNSTRFDTPKQVATGNTYNYVAALKKKTRKKKQALQHQEGFCSQPRKLGTMKLLTIKHMKYLAHRISCRINTKQTDMKILKSLMCRGVQ